LPFGTRTAGGAFRWFAAGNDRWFAICGPPARSHLTPLHRCHGGSGRRLAVARSGLAPAHDGSVNGNGSTWRALKRVAAGRTWRPPAPSVPQRTAYTRKVSSAKRLLHRRAAAHVSLAYKSHATCLLVAFTHPTHTYQRAAACSYNGFPVAALSIITSTSSTLVRWYLHHHHYAILPALLHAIPAAQEPPATCRAAHLASPLMFHHAHARSFCCTTRRRRKNAPRLPKTLLGNNRLGGQAVRACLLRVQFVGRILQRAYLEQTRIFMSCCRSIWLGLCLTECVSV